MAYYYSPFRKTYTPGEYQCPFCNKDMMVAQTIKRPNGTPYRNEYYAWVINAFPKFEGHTMLVPHEHLLDFDKESNESILARHELLVEVVAVIRNKFPDCGIEHFVQTGSGSASSVAHLHWHLVPASPSDELRSFEKMGHFYTTKPDDEKVVIFPKTITMEPDTLLRFLGTPYEKGLDQ
jgi:diadenosine tetraphosphate (Ap4A) HIT family hydrolase